MDSEQAAPAAPGAGRAQSRGRSTAMWLVLVLAGLLLLLSAFAVWIDRVALNTSVFASTSSTLLDDPKIRTAVANRAVDELFSSVDVQSEVKDQLPDNYKSLSGPATAGLRQASYQIVARALEQPAFQRLFKGTLEETHRTLVQVLEGGGDRVSTENGEVTLNLRTIIQEAADRIGIGDQVADKIPPDAGQIVVLRAEELDTAQNAFELLKTLAWVLPLLTLAAFAIAIWLARDRRRAVRGIGFTVAVVGILGLLAARLTRLCRRLARRARDDRQAATNAWNILSELMRSSFRLMVAVGILFLVAAWLAGPGRRALPHAAGSRRAAQPRGAYVALACSGCSSSSTRGGRLHAALTVAILVALGVAWIEITRRKRCASFRTQAVRRLSPMRVSGCPTGGTRGGANAPRGVRQRLPRGTDVTARLACSRTCTGGALTDEEYAAAKARSSAGE